MKDTMWWRGALGAAIAVCMATLVACGDDDAPLPSCTNCAGCCDANGACYPGTESSACGTGGAICTQCPVGQRCINGRCSEEPCGPENCPNGCCKNGQCITAVSDTACGKNGMSCVTCPAQQQCTSGVCQAKPCSEICPNGCCFNNVCMPGTNPGACGTGGNPCEKCAAGEVCENKACKSVQCGPSTCSDGCCDANGNCVNGTSETACGTGGETCERCQTSQVCDNGTCEEQTSQCSPSTCAGCCGTNASGVTECMPGNVEAACGIGGEPCMSCSSTQECVNADCTCTASSCSGCCDGNMCRPGNTDAACGSGGSSCQKCTGGTYCVDGQCKAICSYESCAGGCCDGTQCKTGGDGDEAACGINGIACQSCDSWETCVYGVCNDGAKCGPSDCPNGCCKNSTCKPGTADDACGSSGDVCALCPPFKSCNNGECAVDSASQWRVKVVEVQLDSSKNWDNVSGFEAPDVYVELQVGNQTKQTTVKSDDYNPLFDEYLMTATAADLMGTIKIKVYDSDPLWFDNLIAECTDTFYEFELDTGMATLYYCGTSPDLQMIKFAFSPVI